MMSGCESLEEEDSLPPTEEWAPLGQAGSSMPKAQAPPIAATPTQCSPDSTTQYVDASRLEELEEQQEQLNTALLELTTHFAQVQFRLEQINTADTEQKDGLLSELMDFASKGCPDIMEVKKQHEKVRRSSSSAAEHEANIELNREKQHLLIKQLKEQLEEIERYAYESGDGSIPTSELMERQSMIIQHLQQKMDLQIDQVDQVDRDELQQKVDQAVRNLINPIKVKDQLVEQLKTQVDDLHRFVQYLQTSDGTNPPPCTCLQDDDQSKDRVDRMPCPMHHPDRFIAAQKSWGFNKKAGKLMGSKEAAGMLASVQAAQLYLLSLGM